MTVGRIRNRSEHRFLVDLQADLRRGAYRPSPARRKFIPKAGKPGQFRPLGIPTIRDRVVQGAVKVLLEPIFEAQFWHVSYGFRPGRNTHGALEYIRRAALPQKRDRDTRSVLCQKIDVVGAQGNRAEIKPLVFLIDKEEWFVPYIERKWFVAETALRECVGQNDLYDLYSDVGELLFKVSQYVACG
ncbi:reverse transcriptase domain-containing protein [Mesorhizobium sophorae]|uniref:reverse transcriptase domain-containing protein n=1 Tax=Mesorhizobium sophorae TaxID=1300294 RepID=UPI001FD9166A|nr:reverse transcriptase domain-containing protein [Mesorhizobium sophorae]